MPAREEHQDDKEFDDFFDDDTDGDTAEAESSDNVEGDNADSAEATDGATAAKERAKHSDERSRRERFREWRSARPFAGGLLMLLSGIIMVAPAYFTVQISDLLVMISTISGVSTLLIGALLIMFGIGTWLQPYAATYLGVLGIIVSIVAVPTSNLGGFFVGSLLGIIGGALALGWEKGAKHRGAKHSRRKPTSAATSVLAVMASLSVVAGMLHDEPKVNAQEGLPLPQLPTSIALPQPPQLPQLPAPQLPQPSLPQPPAPSDAPGPVSELLTPQPIDTPLKDVPPGNISTVRADHVAITGNVHATLGMVNVGGVPQRTLVLTGDELRARNLSLEIPGFPGRGLLTTGQVETKLSNGPVRIVATGLTATPAVANVPTLPLTVDLGGDLGAILQQLGVPDAKPVPNVPVPDMVMQQVSLNNANLQLVSLSGLHLHAPAVKLTSYMR